MLEALVEKQLQTEPQKRYSQPVFWVAFEVHFTQVTGFLDYFFLFNLAETIGCPTERYSVLMFGQVWVYLRYVMPEMRFQNTYCHIYK